MTGALASRVHTRATARHGGVAARPTSPPVVMVIADAHGPLGESGQREYRLGAEYSKAIAEAGGLALILPHDSGQIAAMLELADGLLVTGSAPGAAQDTARYSFEHKLVQAALNCGMPLLGICHGMQVIGQCLGGTLVRDDPCLLAETSLHIPKPVPDEVAHDIHIEAASQLAAWSPSLLCQVNSLHRHALLEGGRYRVTARASDGVVEAIEGLGASFCMGVQWHPEFQLTDLDRQIFSGFVKHCINWKSVVEKSSPRAMETESA